MNRWFWAAALVLSTLPLAAEPEKLPPILDAGFSHLQSFGPEQALRTWSRDSRLLTPESLASLKEELTALHKPLGTYRNRESIALRPAGGGTALFWVAARFEQGTLYFRFLLFEDRIVNGIAFSTDPARILPPDLLEKQTAR